MFAPLAFSLTTLVLGAQALVPDNLVAPATTGALSALKYTGVGGKGSYKQVTNLVPGTFPTCSANPSCVQSDKAVSGNLAPFDEDLTFVFRGPMQIHNIAVYSPSNSSGATWKQTSSFTPNKAPQNMVFMNNMGGGASGTWSICGGASQSYAGGDFASAVASANAQPYSGKVPSGKEVNIVTSTVCKAGVCDGFFRGTANKGWDGSKMLVVNFEMPSDAANPPAIWGLNGQIVRSAQYGCNCRGQGSPGGCGEIDIAEVLQAGSNQAISEIYSFKGATGSGNGNFFPRPTSGASTIAAIFDVQTDAIMLVRVAEWDFTQSQITRSMIDGYLSAPAMQVPFGTNKRRSERPFHRRHHW